MWTTTLTPIFGAVTRWFCPEVETTERLKAECQCLKVFSQGLIISSERNPSCPFWGIPPGSSILGSWREKEGWGSHVSECRYHMLSMPSQRMSPETKLFCVCRKYLEQSWQFTHYMYSQQCWLSSAFSHIPTPHLTEPKFSKFWNFKPSVYRNSPYSTVMILPEST